MTLGSGNADIKVAGLAHPVTQAIAAITIFYGAVRQLALDPDAPPHLVKATLTE